MLKIGVFSKLSRISIRMLRHYDEIGLLEPKTIDSESGYRYYSEAQLPIAERITSLKQMGFSLAVIKEITENFDNAQAFSQLLAVKKAEVTEEAEDIRRRLVLLETTIAKLRKDESVMNYSVSLKEMPERYVASVRQIIPAYDQEGMLWHTLMAETAPLQIQDTEPCYTLAIFHDGEHKESDVDVEVQKSVKGTYPNTEHVVFKTVPPELIASATYQGSYEKISEVNEAVANWVRDNDYEFNGLSFSIYHISPHETSDSSQWVTEVCYPVKKK